MRTKIALSPRVLAYFLLAAVVLTAGCANLNRPEVATPAADHTGKAPPNALPISGLPIPADAKLDTDQSIIMGGMDHWIGRVVLYVGSSPTESYNFFQKGMPSYGWTPVTAVQSNISTLTYLRPSQVATVQIEAANLGGAKITVVVSPRQIAPAAPPGATQPQ